ncbi:glycosyl hydrolase 2 galactose-binding domain-containing protein [Serratia sp. BNK-10]|uniref:glycoside hydrolase family 2 protein n=1 Tax=Serratia TaxID=613 RepID=UPI000B5E29B3|nr:sugar-binding domain-containing protein [Serratia marcescens]ASM02338.1 glycoside hydrolase [Serratia marcescens]
MKTRIWLSLGLLVCASSPLAQTPRSVSLDGIWQYQNANPPHDDRQRLTPNWRPLRVPANWYSDGVDHQGALWYRTTFTLPHLTRDRLATLTFDGVDYRADVWLNQRFVGQHQGYFQRFQFDVTHAARRENHLLVRVDSPFERPGSVWPLHKRAIKGVLSQHDTRPGGAWSPQGQDANSGGIWQPVTLRLSRGAAIDNLTALPDWRQGLEKPALDIRLDYRVNRPRKARLTLRLTPLNFTGKSYHLSRRVVLTGGAPLAVSLPMPGAALWWPYGHGAQNLYRIEATLSDTEGILDRRTAQTGLREVRELASGHGWTINGRRLFIRGTNYIGSPWLGSMTAALYRRDLLLMRAANINAVRVHGHVAGRALYREADALGMLLWQDMPLQWGYDDSEAFAAEAARQAGDLLKQRGNHPSVIVWAGQNEPPFDAPWMKQRFTDWTPTLNRRLAHRVADALSEDRSRIVHRWSTVAEHYWQGWYFGTIADFLKPATSPIISEFGAQALPRLATLRTIIPAAHLWPASTSPDDPGWKVWQYHNFQPEQAFGLAKLSRGATIESFIANTQRYQAEGIQLAAESYRRQRYQPVVALFQFMFSETWPSINWAVIDYQRHPKTGYYALQRAYQPVLPSIEPLSLNWRTGESGKIGLWAINDRWQDYPAATLRWRVTQGEHELARGETTLDLPADSSRKLKELNLTPRSTLPLQVVTELTDSNGLRLGENRRRFPVGAP